MPDPENFSGIQPKGIYPYDLAGEFCEECGRHKTARLFYDGLGCQGCARRPDIETLAIGATWECPDCGSIYGVSSHRAYCGECGHVIQEGRWDLVLKGDRIDSAPRYKPQVYTPLRNIFKAKDGVPQEPGKPSPGLPF